MISPFSNPFVILQDKIRQAPEFPDIITVNRLDWVRLWLALPPAVRARYRHKGFNRVSRRKNGSAWDMEKMRERPYVRSIQIKGIPVVERDEYARLMQGHTSSRIVLAV